MKRPTIKDIANQAGVSLGSVHCALSGKPGVSAETRSRIIKISADIGYRPNTMAASLKRKALRLAAVLPGPTEDNRYYFSDIWDGFRDCLKTVWDINIEVAEMPYYRGVNNQAEELRELLARPRLDGLLTVGFMDNEATAALDHFVRSGVPVALVGSDLPVAGRFCCVQPEYDVVGQMLGEIVGTLADGAGGILVCTGDVLHISNYRTLLGFENHLLARGLPNAVRKVNTKRISPEKLEQLSGILDRERDLAACVSISARGSVLLGEALRSSGRAGRIPAVGSDLFPESAACLRDGVFDCVVHKNPYSQAFFGTKALLDFLIRDQRPASEVMHVGCDIVLRSSLRLYEKGRQSLHVFTA